MAASEDGRAVNGGDRLELELALDQRRRGLAASGKNCAEHCQAEGWESKGEQVNARKRIMGGSA